MKRFRTLYSYLAIAAIGAAGLATSCNRDKCEGVFCKNKGACISGECQCLDGSGGYNCDTMYKLLLANTYKGSIRDNSGTFYYNHKISCYALNDTSLTEMMLDWKTGADSIKYSLPVVFSQINRYRATIYIPTIIIGNYSVSGSGFITTDSLTLSVSEQPTVGGAGLQYTFQNFKKQ